MNWIDPKDRKPPADRRLVLLSTPGFAAPFAVGFWSPYAGGTWCFNSKHHSIDAVSAWSAIEPPPKPPREKPTGETLARAMEVSAGVLCNDPDRDKISQLVGDYYVRGKRYFVWVQLEAEIT